MDQQRQKKGTALDVLKSNFDKLTSQFINTKKINEEGSINMMVNVNINPLNGSKEINLSSTVKFFNYLDVGIEIGFLANG